jgi:hypothetical protein
MEVSTGAVQRLRAGATVWGLTSYRTRAPFIVALASAGSLAFPSQTYEIYRHLALDPAGQASGLLSTAVALGALATGLWLLSLALTDGGNGFRRALAGACGAILAWCAAPVSAPTASAW